MESALARTNKAGLSTSIEARKLFPDVHLERVKGVWDRVGMILWLESLVWAAEAFCRSATSAKAGMVSPHNALFWRATDNTKIVILPVVTTLLSSWRLTPGRDRISS